MLCEWTSFVLSLKIVSQRLTPYNMYSISVVTPAPASMATPVSPTLSPLILPPTTLPPPTLPSIRSIFPEVDGDAQARAYPAAHPMATFNTIANAAISTSPSSSLSASVRGSPTLRGRTHASLVASPSSDGKVLLSASASPSGRRNARPNSSTSESTHPKAGASGSQGKPSLFQPRTLGLT